MTNTRYGLTPGLKHMLAFYVWILERYLNCFELKVTQDCVTIFLHYFFFHGRIKIHNKQSLEYTSLPLKGGQCQQCQKERRQHK